MRNIAALNIIPVFGWLLSALLAFFLAIPLWVLWSWLGPKFFWFVPQVYLDIGFWETVGMLVLVGFMKIIFLPNFSTTVKKG